MTFFPFRKQVCHQNMFRVKLQCQIIDFSNNYKLLHFQFDQWIYKTVSGMNWQAILLYLTRSQQQFPNFCYIIIICQF